MIFYTWLTYLLELKYMHLLCIYLKNNVSFFQMIFCSQSLIYKLPSIIIILFQQQIKMSDIDHLVQLIQSILQPKDQDLRKKSEDTLTELRTTHPNQLIITLLTILQNKNKIQIRNFAATQLRLSLSLFSPSTYTNLWSKLSPQNQNVVKIKLFEIIYKQSDLSMKKHIADTLGEIAGSILSADNEAWPDFKKNVWVLLQDTNIDSNLSAFNILESFFTYAPGHFKDNANDLYALFKAALGHENCKLKLASLRCFQAYLQVLDTKKAVKFQQLVIPIYETVYLLLINDNMNQQGLEILSQMLDIDSKFFKKKFQELSQLMSKIFHIPKLQNGIKRMATELLIDYAEKFPALYRKKKQILNQTIEMIFAHMIEIGNKISDEWKSPPQGFSDDMQDDDDFETTRFGMSAIDRLIFAVGQQEMLPILSQTIQKMLAQQDWRYKYTAVMALSQIGEYIEQPEKISSIIDMIARFLKHENPMIRYSACHAIGQISDDMQPKFQQKYGDILLPQVLQLLGDPIPRVVAHCAAALTNFLEQMQPKQVLPYADKLMEMLIYYGKNGISLVKESCLSAISSVAEVLNEQFIKYFQTTMELLFSIFKHHTTKQYKQLKGQCIQTITIIATSVGAQAFQPVAGQLIDLMIALQGSQFEQVDPQKTYLLAGWQRLCMLYGKNLAGKLDQILPTLFQLVQNVINNQLKYAKDPEVKPKQEKSEKQQQNINTFETEQAEVAISMLNIFIEKLKELYAPYVQRTVKLLCTIIKEHPNEDVKQEACKCLPNLIAAVKVSDQKIATQMAKYFMDTLVSTIQDQYDNDVVIVQLQSLKCVIEQLGLCFLNENQLSAFSKKILAFLEKSDQQKKRNADFLKQQDIDEEDKQAIDEEIKIQQEVQVAISELIGVLFKTHKSMTMDLANHLMDNVLPKAFEDGQSEIMNKFGIFLIDDLVEFLGFQLLSNRWQIFSNSLMKFSQVKSCVIRQASCYGLGVLAQNTPSHVVNQQILKAWLNSLISAANVPKGSEKEKTYGHCRDNAIASVGKILKAHFTTFDNRQYLARWMSMLPLKHDKPQALIQHQFLVDIINSKPSHLLGDNPDQKLINIHKVLVLFSEINSFHKITNKTIKEKMKQFIVSLNNDPFFAEHQAKIWQTLNQKQQKQLHDLLK